MRQYSLIVFAMSLLFHSSLASADSTNTGIVSKNTGIGIVFGTGERYGLYPRVPIRLENGIAGKISDIHSGDRIRIVLDDAGKVVSVTVMGAAVTERVEHSLLDDEPITTIRYWNKHSDEVAIGGKVFPRGGTTNLLPREYDPEKTVFSNSADYDLLECSVGIAQGTKATAYFTVLGDGQPLFVSKNMSADDSPVKINVSIRGISGITLESKGTSAEAQDDGAIWADPILVKLPTTLPQLLYPGENEKISQATTLLWKAVDGATGYLLELQCVQNNNPKPEDAASSFVTQPLPADTTTYKFDAGKMPKGKWQWRVHALNKTGFLGHMDDWRVFYNQ